MEKKKNKTMGKENTNTKDNKHTHTPRNTHPHKNTNGLQFCFTLPDFEMLSALSVPD